MKLETKIFELEDQWVLAMRLQHMQMGRYQDQTRYQILVLIPEERDGRYHASDWSVSDNARLWLVQSDIPVVIKTSSCHQTRTFDTDTFCLLNCQALGHFEVQTRLAVHRDKLLYEVFWILSSIPTNYSTWDQYKFSDIPNLDFPIEGLDVEIGLANG